ncbi:MAG: DUF2510 domain-containing protein [Cellulomonadaceae bacterium]|nr:DUF2510 domain-containing protein [Cellulomonadaceae bacterium]
MTTPPPGWYRDPEHAATERWFDGFAWTDHRRSTQPAPPPYGQGAPTGQGAYVHDPYGQGPWGQGPTYAQPRPVWQPPTPEPRSGRRTAVIVVSIVTVLFLLTVLPAIAIPVFLNQRNKAELAALNTLTCQDVGDDAVTYSAEEAGTDLIALTSTSDMVLTNDLRGSLRRPTGSSTTLVMTCTGTGGWADGVSTPLTVSLYIDAQIDHSVQMSWEE